MSPSPFRYFDWAVGLIVIVAPPVAYLNGVSLNLPSFIPFSPVAPILVLTGVNASYTDYVLAAYALYLGITYRRYVNAHVDQYWNVLKSEALEVQLDSRSDLKKRNWKVPLLCIAVATGFYLQLRLSIRDELGLAAQLFSLTIYLVACLLFLTQARSYFARNDQAAALTQRSNLLQEHDATASRNAAPAFALQQMRGSDKERRRDDLSKGADEAAPSSEWSSRFSGGVKARESKSIFKPPAIPTQTETIFTKRDDYYVFLAAVILMGSVVFVGIFILPLATNPVQSIVGTAEGVIVESHPPTGHCLLSSRRNYNYGVVTIKFTMSNGQDCTVTQMTCLTAAAGTRVIVQPASWTYCGGAINWRLIDPPLSPYWTDAPRQPIRIDPNTPHWNR